MKRFVVLLGMTLTLWSCSGDDATPVGQYGEECDVSTTCAEGLRCTLGLCTAPCSAAQDCQAWSPTGDCFGGTCFDKCMDRTHCKNGLICSMVGTTEGSCRPQ